MPAAPTPAILMSAAKSYGLQNLDPKQARMISILAKVFEVATNGGPDYTQGTAGHDLNQLFLDAERSTAGMCKEDMIAALTGIEALYGLTVVGQNITLALQLQLTKLHRNQSDDALDRANMHLEYYLQAILPA